MNRELLKQVLDALKLAVLRSEKIIDKEYDAAITALEAELEKIEQKPLTKEDVDALLIKHGKGDDGFYAFAMAIENIWREK